MAIIGIQEDKGAQNKQAADRAQLGMGQALAELFVKFVQGQATSLKMYLKDIAVLSREGRIGFRVSLSTHLKELSRYVKAKKGDKDYALYQRAKNSAAVRISEAVVFSKAIDAGMAYDPASMDNYHAIIAFSRTFLDSASATGPSTKRGRKATPLMEKIAKYLADAKANGADMGEVAKLVEKLGEE